MVHMGGVVNLDNSEVRSRVRGCAWLVCGPGGGSPNVDSIHIAQNGGSLPCVRVKQTP